MKRLLLTTFTSLSLLFAGCDNEESVILPIEVPEPTHVECDCGDIQEFWGSTCMSSCDFGYWDNLWFIDNQSVVWEPWPLPGPIFPDPVILPDDMVVFEEGEGDFLTIAETETDPAPTPTPIVAPTWGPLMNMYVPVEICEGVPEIAPAIGCYHIEYQIIEDFDFTEAEGTCISILPNAIPVRIISIEEAGPCAFPQQFEPVIVF